VPQLLASIPFDDGSVTLRLTVELIGRPGPLRFGYQGEIDTGFSGGLRGDENLHEVLSDMGFEAADATVSLADQKVHDAWVYPVRILTIAAPTEEVVLTSPVPTILVCFQAGGCLVGLGAFEQWIVELDGPGRMLRISVP